MVISLVVGEGFVRHFGHRPTLRNARIAPAACSVGALLSLRIQLKSRKFACGGKGTDDEYRWD